MHAWQFDVVTGTNLAGGGGLRVYDVCEIEGGVWVRSSDIA
jgi:nitrite reductase/ring-hydroxylating ferredoxin subunit